MCCLPVLLAAAPGSAVSPVSHPPARHVQHATTHVQPLPPDHDVAVLGRPVCSPSGKTIGRLIDVLVNAAGKPEAAVIDFGGFMGVGARKIAVHWSTLRFAPGDRKHPITLELTPNQIKAAPEYKTTSRSVPVVVRGAKHAVAALHPIGPPSGKAVPLLQAAHAAGP